MVLALNSTRGSPPQRSKSPIKIHDPRSTTTTYDELSEELAIAPQVLSDGVPRTGLILQRLCDPEPPQYLTFLSRISRTADIWLLDRFGRFERARFDSRSRMGDWSITQDIENALVEEDKTYHASWRPRRRRDFWGAGAQETTRICVDWYSSLPI
jgi:hypothetical protein